jgi:DNA-binding transcriptional ArsR family regulator
MPDRDNLESFIGNGFRSVWALEVLKFLVENPAHPFSAQELIAALRVSDAVVSQSVENLLAAGLVIVDGEGRVELHQGGAAQSRLVRSAVELYQRSPDKVRRLIVAQASPGLTAFADAFKLRKD